jgi:hypothetical protein
LQSGATEKEIQTAYRVLVKVWHPDRFQNDSTLKAEADEKLKEINSAFRYLNSKAAQQESTRQEATRQGQRHARPRAYDYPPPADPYSNGNDPHGKDSSEDESDSVQQPQPTRAVRPRWLLFLIAITFSPLVRTCAFIAAFALISWILFKPIDSFLASEPLTAGTYGQLKIDVQRGLWGAKAMVAGYVSEIWPSRNRHKSSPPVQPEDSAAPQQDPGELAAQNTTKPHSNATPTENAAPSSAGKLLPYVTAGLSKQEVIAIQGPPTSSSENKLIYGHSELDFNGDKLVAWKIDPESPHIRIKLWPDSQIDPDLDTFWVGSSKNEVLVVMGTPTVWSENTWAYGGSEVYFKDGRVVSWKNDPATVPLRAARR